jgi:predicted DNA-binding transcriptional regulator YafY
MLSASSGENDGMRRADRLFEIIQILRRTRRPLTAAAIGAELETSKRTVYRDIAALIGQLVPIRGEAGMGYVLEGGFDLPPLMLTPDEIEAAVLGAQLVAAQSDAALARAADDLVAKIAAVVPERLRPFVLEPATGAPPRRDKPPDRLDMARLRTWIHTGRKIGLRYRDEQDRETERIVWPVIVGYLDAVRHVIAWCELRQDFRNFRTDRVIEAAFLDEHYPERPSVLKAKWRHTLAQQCTDRDAEGSRRERPVDDRTGDKDAAMGRS